MTKVDNDIIRRLHTAAELVADHFNGEGVGRIIDDAVAEISRLREMTRIPAIRLPTA